MSRSIGPSALRCCISARSSSKAHAPRWSPTPAPGRSILGTNAFALNGIDAFYGDSHVLEKVSFSLGEGRLLGLLGRNGAGKSTCMNVAVGLLPPRGGTVELFGTEVTRLPPELIAARGLALVPQGRRIFKSLTVRENLAVAARRPDPGSRHAPWTADTVFAMFPRLAERRRQIAAYLSGGEQQMLAIGRALMANPRVLLMDEPSEGLAPQIVADRMRGTLGQPFVIENVGGAGGSLGVGRLTRAVPNGYTIGMGDIGAFVLNGAVYPLPYDLLTEFEPIALLAMSPLLVLARNTMPAKDLKELTIWLKANQDKVSQGHIGSGTLSHLCGLYMQSTAGATWPFVPYRGAAAALQDLTGAQIDLICAAPGGSALPLAREGRIKAYAVMAGTRLPSAPEIPTADEAGLPGFHLSFWQAM